MEKINKLFRALNPNTSDRVRAPPASSPDHLADPPGSPASVVASDSFETVTLPLSPELTQHGSPLHNSPAADKIGPAPPSPPPDAIHRDHLHADERDGSNEDNYERYISSSDGETSLPSPDPGQRPHNNPISMTGPSSWSPVDPSPNTPTPLSNSMDDTDVSLNDSPSNDAKGSSPAFCDQNQLTHDSLGRDNTRPYSGRAARDDSPGHRTARQEGEADPPLTNPQGQNLREGIRTGTSKIRKNLKAIAISVITR